MDIDRILASDNFNHIFDKLNHDLKIPLVVIARLALSIGVNASQRGFSINGFTDNSSGKEFRTRSFFAKNPHYYDFVNVVFKDLKRKNLYSGEFRDFLKDSINFGLFALESISHQSRNCYDLVKTIHRIKFDKNFADFLFSKSKESSLKIDRKDDLKQPNSKTTPPKANSIANLDNDEENYINQIRLQINEFFTSHKFSVTKNDYVLSPSVLRIKIKIDVYSSPKNAFRKINSLLEDLKLQLELSEDIILTNTSGYLCFDLPRKKREILYLKDIINSVNYKSNVEFPIGNTIEGEVLSIDLSNSNTPHLLIAGATGQGKSECLKAIVSTLIQRNTPNEMKLLLIDPKMGEFIKFKNSPFLLHDVISDIENTVKQLEELCSEMDERYKIIAESGFNNIDKYNKTIETKLPRIVVFFDEFADFMVSAEKPVKKRLEDCMKRLTAKARAAGIHLILSTQRPDRNVMEGVIKSNIPARISLKTSSIQDSQIIIGNPDAYKLYGRGDMIISREGKFDRVQGAFISDQEMDQLI